MLERIRRLDSLCFQHTSRHMHTNPQYAYLSVHGCLLAYACVHVCTCVPACVFWRLRIHLIATHMLKCTAHDKIYCLNAIILECSSTNVHFLSHVKIRMKTCKEYIYIIICRSSSRSEYTVFGSQSTQVRALQT